jgi:N-acetylglucosaminyldiphosphoundecaprenol N-acetyl-beta-D-mannosaminyltransferase
MASSPMARSARGTSEALLPTIDIMGCRINHVSLDDTVNQLECWIREPFERCRFVVATGFHGLWVAHRNSEFKKLLNSADLFCPDGIAPVWLSRLQGGSRLAVRIPGPDLLEAFMGRAHEKAYSSFFLGDSENTLASMKARLKAEFPRHRIAGSLSPPFRALTTRENADIVDTINRARPDVLWVALGLPKQERWIYENLDRLDVPVAVAVGAAFGFLSGHIPRAPQWIGNNGLEWLWRLTMEPRKMWKRDIIDGPRFLAVALREVLRARASTRRSHQPSSALAGMGAVTRRRAARR